MSIDWKKDEIRKKRFFKSLWENQQDIVTELFNKKIHSLLPKVEKYPFFFSKREKEKDMNLRLEHLVFLEKRLEV